MKYNYLEQMSIDVQRYVVQNVDLDTTEDVEQLKDDLYGELYLSEITGTESSYRLDGDRAGEAIAQNWGLLADALNEDFPGVYHDETDLRPSWSYNPVENGPGWCDMVIRCHLLATVIDSVIDEFLLRKKEELQ